MAEHAMHIEMVEVKPQDIIGERRSMYEHFLTGSRWAIGLTALTLILLYLFLG